MASFRAPLSRSEETTLHLIANGAADPKQLRPADVGRLVALGLVTHVEGMPTVTPAGIDRCRGVTRFVYRQEQAQQQRLRHRRLKSRSLPF
jgi:hypothetical protein